MDNIAGRSYWRLLDTEASSATRYIVILLGISFILSLIFIIVQNYVNDAESIWILTCTYINIIIVTLCFIIYARSLYGLQRSQSEELIDRD